MTLDDTDAELLLRDCVVICDEGDHWSVLVGGEPLYRGSEWECDRWKDQLYRGLAPRLREMLQHDEWQRRLEFLRRHR